MRETKKKRIIKIIYMRMSIYKKQDYIRRNTENKN